LQILRFLAALGVLVDHAADIFVQEGGVFDRLPLTGGVDIFFVISGFVMTWITRTETRGAATARTFLVRRAIRIVPAYWFFTTLLVAVVLLSPELVRNTIVNTASVATSYAFIPWPRPDGHINPILSQGWTLNYEIFFYLAFAASLLMVRGQLFLVCAFLALAGINLMTNPESLMLSFYTDPIILEFVAGTLVARVYLAGVRISAWSSVVLIAAAIAAFLLLEPLELGRFARAVGWGLPATMVVGALILRPEPEQSGLVRRILQAGGDASYTIYLSHTFTINGLAILTTRIAGVPDGMALCCAVIASILAAVLFYRLVELPFTTRLQRFAFGRRMPSIQNVAP
jgi:peptidoglycan/LPS O-acetylase OafA/YrhL